MTPDGNPLVGELPGVPGFFVAAGLSLNGFGGAGGIGKAIAELVTSGRERARPAGLPALALRRGAPRPALRRRERARGLSLLLPPALPARQRRARAAQAHERAAHAHAGRRRRLRGKNGWERADYCEPGQPWRRAGEEQRAFGWAEPPYAPVLAEESAALRERVGLIDMTLVRQDRGRGPGRRVRCSSACATHTSIASPGSVVYTQFLERARRHRRRRDRHAPRPRSASAWSRARPPSTPTSAGCACTSATATRRRAARRDRRAVRDRHVGSARARRPAGGHRGRRRGRRLPVRPRARPRGSAGAPLWAQRITYVGELGYELYAEPGWGIQVWDRLSAAGARYGIRPGRLPRARLAAHGEGLPGLRQRPHRRRHAGRGRTRLLRGAGAQGRVHRPRSGRGAAPARQRTPPAHAARGRRRPRVRVRRRGGAGRRCGGRPRAQRCLRLHRAAR